MVVVFAIQEMSYLVLGIFDDLLGRYFNLCL